MVHKATHHFDLVNWWLGDVPELVMAHGKREFYLPETARRLGLSGPHERCLTCPEKSKCTFALDIAADPAFKSLYLDNEAHDGYYRDRCVFRPEIDIEDTMNVIVSYRKGTTLSYSLNAFNAWEGYRIAFNGTKGRIEHEIVEQAFAAGATLPEGAERYKVRTRVCRSCCASGSGCTTPVAVSMRTNPSFSVPTQISLLPKAARLTTMP